MPTYQIDTGKGVLEVDHDGPLSDLHGAVQSWMDERDTQKQFDAGMAVQQATLPQEGTNLAPGQMAEDQGPSFLPKKYAYDEKGAVAVTPTQQEVADAMQYQQGDTPVVSIPPLQGDQFAGLNAVTGALSSFTTPKNIGMLAGAGVGGAIGIPAKLIAGAFAVDMGKHLVSESIPEVRDAVIATGWTSPETGAALAEAGLTGLMTAGAAGHALDGRPIGGREVASMAESLREKLIPSIQSEATALKQKVFESDADAMAKEFISKINPPEISKSDVDGALGEMLGEKWTNSQDVATILASRKSAEAKRDAPVEPKLTVTVTDEKSKTEGVPGVSPTAESVQLPEGDVAPPKLDKQDILELIDRNSPGVSLDFKALRNAIGQSDYELRKVPISEINLEPGSEILVDPVRADKAKGPIVIGPDGIVIDGRHRFLSAKNSGEKEVDAYVPVRPTIESDPVISKADSLPTKGAAPTPEKSGAAPTSDYQGVPGAMGPVEAADMQAGQTKIGISHAAVDEQRAGRSNPEAPTEKPSQPTGAETHATIEAKIEADPELPERIVRSVTSGEKKVFDADETAIVRWHINDLTNKLKMEDERTVDLRDSPQEQWDSIQKANDYEARLKDAEQASASAGSAQGSAFRGRQDAINSDYTFGGLMRKARNESGGAPLEPAERAKIAEQAKQIEELQARVQEETAKSETARVQAERASLLESTINDLKKQEADRPKYGKQVFEVAHKIVAKWKVEADEAWAFLNEGPKTVSSGGLSTKELVAWAKVLRGYIGEYGLDFAEASARVIERLGNKAPENIGDTLKKAWVKVQSLIDSEATTKETKRVIKEGVSKPKKGEKTTVDVGARAKSESEAGLKLSDKVAYEAVRAVINSGVKGELEIMKAAHDLLAPHFPDLTPGQLDVAFGRYGKEYVKFPSKEADKVLLSKTRRLRQLQAAIDDVKSTGKTEKSGLQRDKPDADMRQREAELKAAIEEFGKDIAPSEEQLANKERARLTAAKNSIEKLDRQLQGIEEEIKITPKEKSVELEQLHAERDAMRSLKREIEHANEPPAPPEHIQELNRLMDRADILRDKLARLDIEAASRKSTVDTPEIHAVKAEIKKLNGTIAELRKPIPKSAAEKQLDSLSEQRQKLDDILSGKSAPKNPKEWKALSDAASDIKAEILAMQELAAQIKRDAKPKKDPEYAKEQAQIKALEKAIETYAEKTASSDFSAPGKTHGPDTARISALKDIVASRKSAYNAAKDAGKPILTLEEKYNATRLKSIEKQIAEAEARIKAGDYAKRTKKEQPRLTRPVLDAKAKLEAKKVEIEQGREKQRLADRTKLRKIVDAAATGFQSVRGIVLGSDIGVLTRQGLFAWSRPLTAIKATVTAFKAAMSPESMKRWEVEVKEREINGEPALPVRKKAGLQTTDTITHPEELVVTRLLSRIPEFQVGGKTIKLASVGQTLERFQTTFINAVRADLFDSAIKQGMNAEELKLRADFINSATGRGNIRQVPKAMSMIFTSPRYELSRWEMLASPVKNLGALAIDGVHGKLNRGALANLQDLAVTAAGIYGIFKLAQTAAGYNVNWNPTSTDFLKMRKGNDVWDVTAGLAPRLRDVMRLYVAITHPSYKNNIGKTLLNMGLRTINPAVTLPIEQGSLALQRERGEKKPVLPFTGFKSDEERQGLITLAPLILQSTMQALKEDGASSAVFTAAREFVGSSVNRYPESKTEKKSGH